MPSLMPHVGGMHVNLLALSPPLPGRVSVAQPVASLAPSLPGGEGLGRESLNG